MPVTPTPKYEFELWINGAQVGDISRLAQSRRYTLTRNASEQLSFLMDLTAFEDYCAMLGSVPQAVLEADVTDIRVKRNGQYYFGVQVKDMQYNLNQGGVNVEVRATGFLDLFADRYVTANFDGDERVAIAQQLLALTQAGDASNDFDVTLGASQYDTGITDTERNYVDQNVRDGLVNLTNLEDGNFDFKFNYDRTFETFGQIGSLRPQTKFTYPYNIKGGTVSHSALNLYNYIIGLGSGFGEETLRTETADQISRDTYKTRQKIVSFNSVSVQQTLDENTSAYLQRVKNILELPKFSISGELADLNIIGIGDRVPVEVQGHPAIPLNGMYRIEQIDVTLDENDAEDISITVDNYGL
ncbi:MAG: hypothetical protein WC426_13580 [Sulfuriferula sp.]